MGSTSSLYAAIDLGSNSFHMLVVREVAGSIQTLTRIKRKVRLAAGLNSENALSNEAMAVSYTHLFRRTQIAIGLKTRIQGWTNIQGV